MASHKSDCSGPCRVEVVEFPANKQGTRKAFRPSSPITVTEAFVRGPCPHKFLTASHRAYVLIRLLSAVAQVFVINL